MADGIQINTGTGPVIATELIGTAMLQRVKLAVGNVDTDSGDISATNPIPITGTVSISSMPSIVVSSVATGTFTVSSMPTTFVTMNGTQSYPNKFQAYCLATTSAGGGVIVVTSGANTIYVTDILVSVPTAMNVGLYSETTGPLVYGYLAANGGWAQNLISPVICTSAQSLRVILSSSGTCSVSVCGYTVT